MPENPVDDADNGELILQEDDPAEDTAQSEPESAPWRILIVDDDVDVHVVTKFALSTTNFQGRRLSFLHAYSAEEAMTILRSTQDIALILLDVIMETPDAGLRLARQVRDELHNDLVRIVLRTGQPGQALEHSIIVDYDINDFWCKADLTTRKLFTTVISSLRAYAALSTAAAERERLSAELARAQQLQAVVTRHALVLTLDPQGRIADANDAVCQLAGMARDELLGREILTLPGGAFPEPLRREIVAALKRDNGWAGDMRVISPKGAPLTLRCAALSFKDGEGGTLKYVAVATVLPC
jgi:PAS domain S-box-containing protein